jgi:hypothetical protein
MHPPPNERKHLPFAPCGTAAAIRTAVPSWPNRSITIGALSAPPGCHASFYKNRCLVCEQPIQQPKRGGERNLCQRAACRNEYRRFPHLFAVARRKPAPSAGNAETTSKTPVKLGPFWRDKSGRAWRWEEVEQLDGDKHWTEHWLINREDDVQARLIPDGDRHIVRLSPGIDLGRLPLEEAKRHAISLSLGRLPLEPKLAARLAKVNELLLDPPQNFVLWCADYLARLAVVGSHVVTDDNDDLDIPPFLQRHTIRQIEAPKKRAA